MFTFVTLLSCKQARATFPLTFDDFGPFPKERRIVEVNSQRFGGDRAQGNSVAKRQQLNHPSDLSNQGNMVGENNVIVLVEARVSQEELQKKEHVANVARIQDLEAQIATMNQVAERKAR